MSGCGARASSREQRVRRSGRVRGPIIGYYLFRRFEENRERF